MNKTVLRVEGYRVLFDRQKEGFPASAGTCSLRDGRLSLVFQMASDAAAGLRSWLAFSDDMGGSWSHPEPFGPVLKHPEKEFQGVNLCGATQAGTELATGFYLPAGVREDKDLAWRPGAALIGRQPAGARDFQWMRYPSGTYLGEQFAAPGVMMHSGRICLTIYGAKHRDENLRCGVLLSDDDGLTWRYRELAYAADPGIRFKPEVPAGYNEQTMFETSDGKLVSIIRGRERLGDSPREEDEPLFSCAISADSGETWQGPEFTNLRGTGAPSNGLALPDGSLILPARIPHHAKDIWMKLEHPELFGLHLARSFDLGKTWQTERILQYAPDGRPFDNYYNAMNGQFVRLSENRSLYVFGHFDYQGNRHRVLCMELAW